MLSRKTQKKAIHAAALAFGVPITVLFVLLFFAFAKRAEGAEPIMYMTWGCRSVEATVGVLGAEVFNLGLAERILGGDCASFIGLPQPRIIVGSVVGQTFSSEGDPYIVFEATDSTGGTWYVPEKKPGLQELPL